MMDYGRVLGDAQAAVRDYAAHISYDVDTARARGDTDLEWTLQNRCEYMHTLADQLSVINPDTVQADAGALAELRALAGQLSFRLASLTPARRVAARSQRKRNTAAVPVGQPPYGYRAVAGGLVVDDTEHQVLERMRQLRRDGASYRQIADALNADGIPGRRGRWHPLTVARIISRETPGTIAVAL